VREIVILLLVVALLVLVIGAVNQDQRVDLDYVFGTWEGVSVLSLSAISAGAAIVLGLVIAAMARMRVVADRRKLERELQLVYPRLREAERAAGLPAWNPPVEAVPAAPVVTAAVPPPVAAAEVTAAEATEEEARDEAPAADPAPPVAAAEADGPAAAQPGSPPNGEA
jgi:uncharacterized membrane protein YciS (DUF1049 family)